jgi:hypothetical protein
MLQEDGKCLFAFYWISIYRNGIGFALLMYGW